MAGSNGMQGFDKADLCALKHVYMQHSIPQGTTCNAVAVTPKYFTPDQCCSC